MFSPDIPPSVNTLLQAAVIATRNNAVQAEKFFLQAYQLDRQCLQTYFALYKFYFYQARLMEAEYFVLEGLKEAARQGGFPEDYRLLYRDKARWNMYIDQTSLFYLYSLKALAFIKLRQGQAVPAQIILAIIKDLDPEDRSGASVIMDLASALKEE